MWCILSVTGSPTRAPGRTLASWSVSPVGLGRFLCDIFDYWVAHDVGRTFVNFFDCTLANWCGVQPGTCSFAQTCGGNAVVEHNGDVYCCDHFVYPQYLLGNIYKDDLAAMMSSQTQCPAAQVPALRCVAAVPRRMPQAQVQCHRLGTDRPQRFVRGLSYVLHPKRTGHAPYEGLARRRQGSRPCNDAVNHYICSYG